MKKHSKQERQRLLKEVIEKNPFLTDKELAEKFDVSIQTIRLDRMELKIPEVRERTKNVAHSAYERLKSVEEGEVIGHLVELELNEYAESYLITSQEMALQKSNIIRGHHIFAQANSLAAAVIDAETVLTGSADIIYHQPVDVGDGLTAAASVKDIKEDKFFVEVKTLCEQDVVFTGEFIMFTRKRGRI